MLIFGIIFGAILGFVTYVAYVLVIAFTLWMAVDAAKQDRFWWVLIVIGIPVIGSAVYFFTEKKRLYTEAPSHHIHTSETEQQHEHANPHKHHEKKEEKKDDPIILAEDTQEDVKEEKA